MEKEFSSDDRNKRVEDIMNQVKQYFQYLFLNDFLISRNFSQFNLKKCEDTYIGNPAKNFKGISGGEKRRFLNKI